MRNSRRAFFQSVVAGAVAAPVGAAVAAAAALPSTDPLVQLDAWINARFACEQGLLGAWADEEGKLPYVTFRLGCLPERFPGGEDAAKEALCARLREWLEIAHQNARAKTPAVVARPILIWRTQIQFNDGTLWEKKLGTLMCTREQIEDGTEDPARFALAQLDEETGNYYDSVERIPVRTMRIRARLFIPFAELKGVPEGASLDMIP